MSVFDHHSREQLRRAYAEAWAKHLANSPLTPLEALITDVIGAHPEYQSILANADTAIAFEQNAAGSAENPFLHMGLHLAVREQLSIDRPPGIRDLHRQLQGLYGDAHPAEHALMEALGEELYAAQRSGQAPDERQYLARARNRLAIAKS
jgi:cell division FtsZ-interacting protein ZapD